jgi:hypothetical protein
MVEKGWQSNMLRLIVFLCGREAQSAQPRESNSAFKPLREACSEVKVTAFIEKGYCIK